MKTRELTCGIDVHYKKSYFCMLNKVGEKIDLQELPTNKKEILLFLERYKTDKIQYAFEACSMSNYLYDILSDQENTEKIHVVHPYKFKIISECKHKNDKQDSIKLARALLKDYLPYPVYIKSAKSRHLKNLLNLRKRRVINQTKIILQAKCIMRSLGIHTTIASLKSKISFCRLIELVSKDNYEYMTLEILKDDFLKEKDAIKDIEEKIKQHIDKEFAVEYNLITSIPGVGCVTGATLLAVIDSIERFSSADQLSSYFGVIPSERSSGDKIVHGRITKEGSKDARTLLVQSAWVAMNLKRENDQRLLAMKKKYYRITAREKRPQKAIVPVARHLTRIIYGVLKSKTPYSGEI